MKRLLKKSSLHKIVISLLVFIYSSTSPAVAIAELVAMQPEDNSVIEEVNEEVVEEDIPEIETLEPIWLTEGSSATTSNVVVVGEIYIAPQNSFVSITFTKLPENPSKLTITELTLTGEEIETTGATGNKAYDITTDMVNGTFEYDLTLPSNGTDEKIMYGENRGDLINNPKEVTGTVIDNGPSIQVKGLDHFSVYVVTTPESISTKLDNSDKLDSLSRSGTPVLPVANPPLAQACGLDISLVMDNSRSITATQRTQMKDALTAFTSQLAGTPTQFSVTIFGNGATLAQPFTSDISLVNAAINSLPASPTGEYTNWEAGLQVAGASFSGGTDKPNLIIFATDGDPTASTAGSSGPVNETGYTTHLPPAIAAANSIKLGGTRILALGIGNPTVSRLQAISGDLIDTGDVLTSDVITSSFDELAEDLATFAKQTCGGTITINKYYDQVGESYRGGAGWTFNIAGTTKTTDTNGQTESVKVDAGTYSVTETSVLSGYSYDSAACYKKGDIADVPVGQTISDGVGNIQVGDDDIIYCNFVNKTIPGSITILKSAQPKDAQDFTFTTTGLSQATFTLDDDNNADNTYNNSITFSDIKPGTYTVTENITSGWKLTSISCSEGATVDLQNRKVSITITPDLHVSCTFNNTQETGKIIVDKVTDPRGSKQNFIFTTTGPNYNGFTLSDMSAPNEQVLQAGTYSVTETLPEGWHQSDVTCISTYGHTETANNLQLNAGETITCTFTNTKNASISGIKWLDKDADGKKDHKESGIANWKIYLRNSSNTRTLNEVRTSTNGNYVFKNVQPGKYYVCEEKKAVYYQSYPQNGSQYKGLYCYEVILQAGQSVKNQDFGNYQYGKITGVKFEDKDGDGNRDKWDRGIANWSIFLDKNNNGKYDHGIDILVKTNMHGEYKFDNLVPGTYKVCEIQQSGWIKTFPKTNSLCHSSIKITSGGTQVIDFGNFELGSITGIKFEDKDGDGVFDLGETPLKGWKIYIDENNNGRWDYGEKYEVTNSLGRYSFTGLKAGTYIVREVNQSGWTQTTADPESITIKSGTHKLFVNFGNFKDATIKVFKNVVDINSREVKDSHEFTVSLNDENFRTISEKISVMYKVSGPGPFTITEIEDGDYESLGCYLPYGVLATDIKVKSGQTYKVTCTNKQKPASITIIKDVRKKGHGGEPVFSDDLFDIQLKWRKTVIATKSISDSELNPQTAVFDSLNPGHYSFTELYKDGYIFKGCEPFNEVISRGVQHANYYGHKDYQNLSLASNEHVTFICYNEVIKPVLKITKSNDSLVSGMYPGEIVTYTLTITAPNDGKKGKYLIKDVTVTDLAPAGFEYIPGSWSSTSLVTTEPEYIDGKPATWILGDMEEGDTVVLTYKVKISLLQDPGIYEDIAWTEGISLAGDKVVGNKKSGVFVGTEVLVLSTPAVEEGRVLGTSTTALLPRTGSGTYITLGALISVLFGLILMFIKPKRGIVFPIIAGAVLFGFSIPFGMLPAHALTEDTVEVKLGQPASPTKMSNFDIGYVVLDRQGRDLKIQCFETAKGSFGPIYTANSGNCVADDTVITGSGTYEFYIKVTAGAYEEYSKKVKVEVNLEKPSSVTKYSKTKGECSYTLAFVTANDGRTSRVQIFRSDTTPFIANSSTLIKTLDLGPNQSISFVDNAVTNCSQNYYYAVRAVDALGNSSPIVTDDIVSTRVVNAADSRTTTTGSLGGNSEVIDTNDTTGDVQKDAEEDTEEESDSEDTGDVKGEDTEAEEGTTSEEGSFWRKNRNFLLGGGIVLGAIVLSVVVYLYANKRK